MGWRRGACRPTDQSSTLDLRGARGQQFLRGRHKLQGKLVGIRIRLGAPHYPEESWLGLLACSGRRGRGRYATGALVRRRKAEHECHRQRVETASIGSARARLVVEALGANSKRNARCNVTSASGVRPAAVSCVERRRRRRRRQQR